MSWFPLSVSSKLGLLSVITCLLLVHVHTDQNKGTGGQKQNVFVPSREWKVVEKGQAIPAGLHVRLNLQSGLTEAKILDENEDVGDEKKTAVLAVDDSVGGTDESVKPKKQVKIFNTAQHVDGVHIMEDEDGKQTVFGHGKLTAEQIQDALQNIKFEDVEVATDEDKERVKANFRSIEELRHDLADLNLGMRTEEEAVTQLLQQFLEPDTTNDTKLSILKDLEYLTHHVDAARDLVDNNGIQLIVVPSLNSTSPSIQSASAKLMGAAAQGNPAVQLAALKEGVLGLLLRQLTVGLRSGTRGEDQDKWKAMVFAISCLTRGFPAGQSNLMDEGGLSVLAKLFDVANMDIKVRITTLLHDLVVENRLSAHSQEQYKAMKLEKSLMQFGWCERISSLLFIPHVDRRIGVEDFQKVETEMSIIPEHDLIEKVISAMDVLMVECRTTFKASLPTLQDLQTEYTELAIREALFSSDDKYYDELLGIIKKLVKSLHLKDEL